MQWTLDDLKGMILICFVQTSADRLSNFIPFLSKNTPATVLLSSRTGWDVSPCVLISRMAASPCAASLSTCRAPGRESLVGGFASSVAEGSSVYPVGVRQESVGWMLLPSDRMWNLKLHQNPTDIAFSTPRLCAFWFPREKDPVTISGLPNSDVLQKRPPR